MINVSDRNQVLANAVGSSTLHYVQIASSWRGEQSGIVAVGDYIPLVLMFYLDGLCMHQSSVIQAWYVSTWKYQEKPAL